VVCRTGDDRSISPIQVETDDGIVNREHARARADLVDLPAALHLPNEFSPRDGPDSVRRRMGSVVLYTLNTDARTPT
jgi:hypothetical protein